MLLRTIIARRGALATALAIMALFVTSCGKSGRRPIYAVQGRVLYEGKPLPNAQVVLHPLVDDKDSPVRPTGRAAEDGSFTLTTYDAADGAPEGEYAVTVDLRRRDPDAEGDASRSILPARYLRPDTSPLRAQISKGKNELPPFELSGH
jgi:hypothetical protein